MIDGIFRHQDSNGGGLITDGDTQWMTAGVRVHLTRGGQ
jgi:quercetin 2,3-dioxygenase